MHSSILGLNDLFGIPAHPLLVHAAVVFIPVALLTLIAALWKTIRRPMLIASALLAIAGAFFVLLATNTGESLAERIKGGETPQIEKHAEAGDRAQAPAVLLAGISILALGADLLRDTDKKIAGKTMPKWAPTALLVGSIVIAVISTVTIVDAGHSGAKSVWDNRATDTGGNSNDDG